MPAHENATSPFSASQIAHSILEMDDYRLDLSEPFDFESFVNFPPEDDVLGGEAA